MLVIRRLFGSGTNCIAPSGLPLLLCLFPGLAPWAFLSRPCGVSFAPETSSASITDQQSRNQKLGDSWRLSVFVVKAGYQPTTKTLRREESRRVFHRSKNHHDR